ncbi:MAG: 2-oxo acid dehydrogenase subunit E2 [Sphingobacteriaceae bacterium]|nr:2-oxo acid dehydrogenase subunit E2 [Sphingobacteriaceae bacterium]
MPQFELILPKMGESVAEATIIKWLKQPGEQIKEDEAIVEIATDKVDSDVPSPVSGKIIKFLFNENEVAQIGDVVCLIETADELTSEKADESHSATHQANPQTPEEIKPEEIPGINYFQPLMSDLILSESGSPRFYSPLVKSIAVGEGISTQELDSILGTGAEGRVTKQDLLDFISARAGNLKAEPVATSPQNTPSEPAFAAKQTFAPSGSDEIIEMDRMRKLIAEHMLMSVQTAPHVTSFVESDVTNIVKWREKNKGSAETKIGEKITYTPIFIQAVAKAIRDFPMINISLNGTQIIKKADINIGLAAALPNGNLIVPVIKKADQLNLIGLTKAVNDLANRSKNNQLLPDEVKEGTFTITNIGSFGNIMGTPIINQPQVAILAIGAIQKKPAVIETEYGDMVGIRHKMYLSLSYDHRIVDGALGGKFLKRISDYLEAWDMNYEI